MNSKLALLSFAPLFSFVVAGCGSSDGTTTTVPTDAGNDSAACAPTGTGTVIVKITGLPAGVGAKVTVTGPGGAKNVTADQTFESAAAGTYTATAERVIAPDPIVRTVYTPTVSTSSFCLANAQTQTITVTYAAIPSSNKLWITNGSSPTDAGLLGFASSTLAAAGSPAATVAAKSGAGGSIAFDKDGNLWASGATTADSTVLRLPAADLGASGTKTPDRKINVKAIACLPATAGKAFDASGNLWVASPCDKRVFRLLATDLASSGDASFTVSMVTEDGAQGVAFDATGNLWVTDATKLYRFDAASLSTSTSPPSATLSIKTKSDGTGAPLKPGWLLFDGSGDLWSSDFGGNVIFRIAKADLAATGSKDVVPPTQITIGVTALLEDMAFDEGGGLWTSFAGGKFIRLAPAQLTVSTGPGAPTTPDRILSSPDMGSALGFAFYPAPANVPLFSALK